MGCVSQFLIPSGCCVIGVADLCSNNKKLRDDNTTTQLTNKTKRHGSTADKQTSNQTTTKMPKKRKTSLGCKRKQERKKATASSTALTLPASSTTKAPAATHQKKRKMSKDPPGVTGRTAAKAKTMRTKASATVDAAAPEIPKNLVEIWKVSVSRAKLLNIHSEEEATIEPDGSLM